MVQNSLKCSDSSHQEDKGRTRLTAYQRHGYGTREYCGNLPQIRDEK